MIVQVMGRSGQFVPPEIQQMVDSHVSRQAANRERRMAEDEQFTKVIIMFLILYQLTINLGIDGGREAKCGQVTGRTFVRRSDENQARSVPGKPDI